MPVNFRQLQNQIHEMGEQTVRYELTLRQGRQEAAELLQKHANDLNKLQERVNQAVDLNNSLRCGTPVTEALDSAISPIPLNASPVLLAADGSQIVPSRHDAYEFGLVNVGLIRMRPGRGETPVESSYPYLLYPGGKDAPDMLSEEYITLRRDLEERRALAKAAEQEPAPAVTLTDGTLEPLREPHASAEKFFGDYVQALEDLAQLNAITAGYVDKPRADLVVRLLELMKLSDDRLNRAGRERPLDGVRDTDLFSALLQPGQRTAIFRLQSSSIKNYSSQTYPHFFYLNVGFPDNPVLARVELPAWVAEDPSLVNCLQVVLLNQCLQMGSKPYPYALHRAHEVAVVGLQEKSQIENLIQLEMLRQGLPVYEKSFKQSWKDTSGNRTRYTP
jgi:hypothetical protein